MSLEPLHCALPRIIAAGASALVGSKMAWFFDLTIITRRQLQAKE
jgi:hypothetical protein